MIFIICLCASGLFGFLFPWLYCAWKCTFRHAHAASAQSHTHMFIWYYNPIVTPWLNIVIVQGLSTEDFLIICIRFSLFSKTVPV